MANKNLFQSLVGKFVPQADVLNREGAPAYALSPKGALAQYAATGCLNRTFYASAENQLAQVLQLCAEVEPEFIAKTAVYCREHGFMKDMPALLCAVLSVKDMTLLEKIFSRVIDNGRMLRNFVQIMRSGAAGRKSLGTAPRRLVREWLDARTDEALFTSSIGQSPSFADIVKMVHPRPREASRAALYGYFIGRDFNAAELPPLVRSYEAFKAGETLNLPDVPFQMLTALELSRLEWTAIARRASWQTTRMNLNTFARHGVFAETDMPELIAERLRDPRAIEKARVFPYQLMAAFMTAAEGVPQIVRDALQDAMEVAIKNVPTVMGKIYVCPDVSGSMSGPVTGYRQGATSKVRCLDVAALVAASVVRKNPRSEVIPFEESVVKINLNPRDSVMTNAAKLAAVGGGGTNCSAPLALLNKQRAVGDLVIYVSDNQSWVDARQGGRGTAMMSEWNKFKANNPAAKLVCLDVQPDGTTQAPEREDVLNIGGFSDRVFEVIAEFAAGRLKGERWARVIESITL
ncbi:MAG TPA: hypothetical protein VM870_06500 [Pyrinomonadaceae bacterium]|jgi:60 kDa SS-A/Ro ribonucleoprotein|nr:hypothetical protein [Pyrinomonadaceae bacterium]